MLGKTDSYFLTIVKEGSLQKAAQALYVSQPSLTKYIQRLEKQLGCQLFDRTVSPMALTDAGQLYHRHLMDAQERARRLAEQLDQLSGRERGTLKLGIPSYCGQCYLPEVIRRFHARYPHVHIELTEGHGEAIERALLDRRIDLGVLHQPVESPQLYARPLFTETVLLAVPGKQEGTVQVRSLTQFRDCGFIMPHREQKLGRIVTDAMTQADFEPHVFTRTENVMTMLELTALGMGVGFIPAGGVPSLPQTIRERVCFFRVRELEPSHWQLMALQRADFDGPEYMEYFVRLLAQYGEERNRFWKNREP